MTFAPLYIGVLSAFLLKSGENGFVLICKHMHGSESQRILTMVSCLRARYVCTVFMICNLQLKINATYVICSSALMKLFVMRRQTLPNTDFKEGRKTKER